MNSEFRKFFIRLGIGSFILLIMASPLLWFNIILDPFGVFLDHYESSSAVVNRRFTKVKYHLNHPNRYTAFIFGSSRVNFINPANIPGDSYFNMHCPSGRPVDHLRDLKILRTTGIKVKKVILGIDFLSLLFDFKIPESDLMHHPYPSTFKEQYDFYKNFLLNIPSRELILETIDKTVAERAVKIGNGQFSIPFEEDSIDGDPGRHIKDMKFRIPFSAYNNPQDCCSGLKHLQELIDYMKSQKIDYQLFINPTQITTYLALNLDVYINTLKKVAEISDFIDFSGLNSVAINNMNFYENSHYREKIGNLIISRIMNRRDSLLPDDFGYYVSKGNVDEQIERHHTWLSDFFCSVRMDSLAGQSIASSSPGSKLKESQDINFRINGLPSNSLSDTTIISTPYLRLNFNRKLSGDQLPVLFLDDETLFLNQISDSMNKSQRCRETIGRASEEWLVSLKRIPEGIHRLSAGITNTVMRTTEKSFEEVWIHVIHETSDTPESGDDLCNIEFQLLTVNGHPAGRDRYQVNMRYMNLTGYAVNRKTFRPQENLALKVNELIYPVRIINENKALNQIYNVSNAQNCGWTAVFPLPDGPSEFRTSAGLMINGQFHALSREIGIIRQQGLDTSILQGLRFHESGTHFHIERINGQQPDHKTLKIKENQLTITGWAVDRLSRQTASKIFIRIGDRLYRADDGHPRQDVAEAYKIPSYERCGWTFEIPTYILQRGCHPMTLVILTHDGTGYYIPGESRNIIIE